jgi:hypothetical protein
MINPSLIPGNSLAYIDMHNINQFNFADLRALHRPLSTTIPPPHPPLKTSKILSSVNHLQNSFSGNYIEPIIVSV